MAAHRWPQSLSLLLAGVVLSLPILGLSGAHHSGIGAIEDGVRGEFGYADGWKIQATETATETVAGSPDVTAVEVGSATLATPTARVESQLWIASNDKAPLGLLSQGRHAQAGGEVTLSRHLAETLGVHPGASLTVHRADGADTTAQVVGITTDPADRDADLAITIAAQGATQGAGSLVPAYWITPSVSDTLDHTPGVSASSVSGTVETRLEHVPGGLTALGRMTPVVTALAILAMLAAVAAQIPATRRDTDALQAAGMPLPRCWRVIAVWVGVLVAAGAALGAAVAFLLLRGLADPISSALGQRWIAASVPTGPIILTAVLPLLVAVVPARWIGRVLGWVQRPGRAPRSLDRVTALVGAVLALVGLAAVAAALLQAHGRLDGSHHEFLGLFGTLAAVLGIHLTGASLIGARRRRPSGRIVGHLIARTVVGTSIALLVGAAGAAYTAWHTHNAYAYSTINIAPQESGSYLVYQAPSQAADQVLARYRALGGRRTFLYQLPDETNSLLRVTTPQMVSCLRHGPAGPELLDSCSTKLAATMNIPALDPALPPASVLVERDVMDTTGRVGLILYRGPDATQVTSTNTVQATAGRGLGGNMPGLVVSPDGPIARQYGLRPSGLVEFGMRDFSSLSAKDAAQVRALVASLAPAAQVSDATTDTTLEAALALSLTAGLATAALALLVQLVTSAGAVSGTRRLRIAVGSMGVTRRRRTATSLSVVAPTFIALIAAGLLARYAGPELGYPAPASVGWTWVLPLLSPAVVLLAQAWTILRPPRR